MLTNVRIVFGQKPPRIVHGPKVDHGKCVDESHLDPRQVTALPQSLVGTAPVEVSRRRKASSQQ